jgi:hypothetical protein
MDLCQNVVKIWLLKKMNGEKYHNISRPLFLFSLTSFLVFLINNFEKISEICVLKVKIQLSFFLGKNSPNK